jgi:hypothetical protein
MDGIPLPPENSGEGGLDSGEEASKRSFEKVHIDGEGILSHDHDVNKLKISWHPRDAPPTAEDLHAA